MPLLVLLGLGGLAGALAWALRTPARATGTIHVLGDSQACIAGRLTTDKDPRRTFLDTITHDTGRPLHVVCKIGSRVADWDPKIDTVPIAAGDVVLVFLGSNEMGNLPDPTRIARSVLRRGGRLLWVGPPAIRGNAGRAPDFLRAKLAALDVPFFDSRTLRLAQADGVHPTQGEADRWLRAVLQAAGV